MLQDAGFGLTRWHRCFVKQLCNLEALGLSATITCYRSALTSRTSDESGKVQVATMAARVNVWASSERERELVTSSDAMYACLNLAATRTAPPYHARHMQRFRSQMVYVGACLH
jgi:hypothetical protein